MTHRRRRREHASPTTPGAPHDADPARGDPARPTPGRTARPARASPGGESAGTVIVAGLANLGIAVAKLIGGLISHSSAMLSEAAHSVADTVTEVLLFVALKRGEKPADEKHPFGYGRETYFWAFSPRWRPSWSAPASRSSRASRRSSSASPRARR